MSIAVANPLTDTTRALQSRVSLVTGSTSAIGLVIARARRSGL